MSDKKITAIVDDLSSVVKENDLKTINGQSLIGSGDISVGGVSAWTHVATLNQNETVNLSNYSEYYVVFDGAGYSSPILPILASTITAKYYVDGQNWFSFSNNQKTIRLNANSVWVNGAKVYVR